jgi:hypothetical protein
MALSRRAWLNLALLVVVVVLAVLAVYQPGIEPPPVSPPLTGLVPAAVARIAVERPEQPTVVIERRDGRWHLTDPLVLPANRFRVENLLEVLEARSDRQLDAPTLELGRFGLDPAKASLQVDGVRLEFGDTESLSGKRYVRIGDTVHLTADRFYHQLTDGAPGFAHLGPLGTGPDPVAIELPDLTLRLDQGRWLVDPDPGYPADAVSRLVEAWRSLQAITVRTFEPREGGRPVTVTLRDQAEPLRFALFETPNALVLARPEAGVQYHLPMDAAERLLRVTVPTAQAPDAEGLAPPGEGPDEAEGPLGALGEEGEDPGDPGEVGDDPGPPAPEAVPPAGGPEVESGGASVQLPPPPAPSPPLP